MPIVVMKDGVKESSLNRSKQHDLPTPLSPGFQYQHSSASIALSYRVLPISNSLIKKS